MYSMEGVQTQKTLIRIDRLNHSTNGTYFNGVADET